MALHSTPRVTLVVDPRFSGGTSTAVASEIMQLASHTRLKVVAIESAMFRGRSVHSALEDACDATGTPLEWNPTAIRSEIVVLHNPSFLKLNDDFPARIICDRLFIVCHENFYRPTGGEGFDIGHCLGLLSANTLARRRFLSPISASNRAGVAEWVRTTDSEWEIAEFDWTNICSFDLDDPVSHPRDRRGRHSRPGFEKFPDLETLSVLFPPHAAANRILGADSLQAEETPQHWELIPFRGETVPNFLGSIDFFVYFTNPAWRESFGRAIAEAIAAGKMVITDPDTASNFGSGIVAAHPDDVDGVISYYLAHPDEYTARIRRAQAELDLFSGDAFLERFRGLISQTAPSDRTIAPKLEEIHALV